MKIVSVILLTLFCNLADAQVQSVIVINNNISIPMLLPTHYLNGNYVTISGAIQVSSDVTWQVSVRANGPLTFGPNQISQNNIGVNVTTPIGLQQPERFLTVSDQLIVDAAPSTYIGPINSPVLLDVKFRATGGLDFFNKPSGSYSLTMTYTLAPD
jgi:hypothetical protein